MNNCLVIERLRAWIAAVARPVGPPPRLTRRGQLLDVLIALVVGIVMTEFALNRQDRPAPLMPYLLPQREEDVFQPGLVVVAIATSAALIYRRRYPLGVLWFVITATLASEGELPRITFFACAIAGCSAAYYSPYRWPTYASLLAAAVMYARFDQEDLPTVPSGMATTLILALVGIGGIALRLWREQAKDGQAKVVALERERAEAVRRAAAEERARIARDLHDVVTHNVSMMVIQAGAARRAMDASPQESKEALLAVEATGRTALNELRQVMGLLTQDDLGEQIDLTPQPDLSQLRSLVERVREAGMPVELRITGEARPIPAGEALAAYRVVQEALTNSVKHAPGASALVSLEYKVDSLQIDVADTGGTAGATTPAGSGRGLIGLRERLAVYGGTLTTGRRLSQDGYRVTATIPLAAT